MPFTHYPKLEFNIIGAWVSPAPPDKPNFLQMPRFSRVNLLNNIELSDDPPILYHSAQNFTRFFGSVASDKKVELRFDFSNDDVHLLDGNPVSDENISKLNYDAEAMVLNYDPSKQGATGKYLVTIYGRWLRVQLKFPDGVPSYVRAYVRASVF